jgi:hypothetical protein
MKGRMIKEMMRMNTTEIKLEAKLVGDIQGFFFVPLIREDTDGAMRRSFACWMIFMPQKENAITVCNRLLFARMVIVLN